MSSDSSSSTLVGSHPDGRRQVLSVAQVERIQPVSISISSPPSPTRTAAESQTSTLVDPPSLPLSTSSSIDHGSAELATDRIALPDHIGALRTRVLASIELSLSDLVEQYATLIERDSRSARQSSGRRRRRKGENDERRKMQRRLHCDARAMNTVEGYSDVDVAMSLEREESEGQPSEGVATRCSGAYSQDSGTWEDFFAMEEEPGDMPMMISRLNCGNQRTDVFQIDVRKTLPLLQQHTVTHIFIPS